MSARVKELEAALKEKEAALKAAREFADEAVKGLAGGDEAAKVIAVELARSMKQVEELQAAIGVERQRADEADFALADALDRARDLERQLAAVTTSSGETEKLPTVDQINRTG